MYKHMPYQWNKQTKKPMHDMSQTPQITVGSWCTHFVILSPLQCGLLDIGAKTCEGPPHFVQDLHSRTSISDCLLAWAVCSLLHMLSIHLELPTLCKYQKWHLRDCNTDITHMKGNRISPLVPSSCGQKIYSLGSFTLKIRHFPHFVASNMHKIASDLRNLLPSGSLKNWTGYCFCF